MKSTEDDRDCLPSLFPVPCTPLSFEEGRILKRGASLLKLPNDVIILGEGIAYTVFTAKPKRDAAAGAAVTYRVEVLPAFDDSVYQAALVALP